ncbi:MAG: hypothetical protein PHD81_04180 [Candidatus Nanoarchaeia archaeon]|nr:hypothetical protein [Candidatus Nanoarchaeia archaeon]MDD5588280.1 hypothetical protein [Candidatus Nanoarchaeia archaeon]
MIKKYLKNIIKKTIFPILGSVIIVSNSIGCQDTSQRKTITGEVSSLSCDKGPINLFGPLACYLNIRESGLSKFETISVRMQYNEPSLVDQISNIINEGDTIRLACRQYPHEHLIGPILVTGSDYCETREDWFEIIKGKNQGYYYLESLNSKPGFPGHAFKKYE